MGRYREQNLVWEATLASTTFSCSGETVRVILNDGRDGPQYLHEASERVYRCRDVSAHTIAFAMITRVLRSPNSLFITPASWKSFNHNGGRLFKICSRLDLLELFNNSEQHLNHQHTTPQWHPTPLAGGCYSGAQLHINTYMFQL